MRSEMKMVMFSTAVVGMVAATALIPAQADTAFFLGGAHARYRIVQPLQRITNADLPNMGATYYDSARRTRPSSTTPVPPGFCPAWAAPPSASRCPTGRASWTRT